MSEPIHWIKRDAATEDAEYWNMTSVAEMAGVHRTTIIKWERRGDIPKAHWNRKKNGRLFTKDMVEKIVAHARATRREDPSEGREEVEL